MSGSSDTSDAGTLFVLAAAYDTVDAALIDYEAVKQVFHHAGEGHNFDASVVACDGDGGTHVITKHEESTRHGLKWGLAAGALCAVLPVVGVLGGLAAGGAIGSAVGHVKGGISNGELERLAEPLQRGQAGLVVVYPARLKEEVVATMRAGHEAVFVALDLDREGLDRQIAADAAPA